MAKPVSYEGPSAGGHLENSGEGAAKYVLNYNMSPHTETLPCGYNVGLMQEASITDFTQGTHFLWPFHRTLCTTNMGWHDISSILGNRA